MNADLPKHLEWLESRPYEQGWVCSMKPEHLADELGQLHIGEKAAEWYQAEIARLQEMLGAAHGETAVPPAPTGGLVEGQLEAADDATWTSSRRPSWGRRCVCARGRNRRFACPRSPRTVPHGAGARCLPNFPNPREYPRRLKIPAWLVPRAVSRSYPASVASMLPEQCLLLPMAVPRGICVKKGRILSRGSGS